VGLIAESRGNRRAALRLLSWLSTPGGAIVLPPHTVELAPTYQILREREIDCVDVMLAELATDITDKCNFRYPIHIATFDSGHFWTLHGGLGLSFSLYDMISLPSIDDLW
jgi:hypothetical protein